MRGHVVGGQQRVVADHLVLQRHRPQVALLLPRPDVAPGDLDVLELLRDADPEVRVGAPPMM